MVLLYLKRQADIGFLYTDANSPEVADYWNTKAPLHPTVPDALALEFSPADPAGTLAAESALSPLARRLGVNCTVVPGYTIDGHAADVAIVAERLGSAARMLITRYGAAQACLKPSEGGAGARIVPAIELADETRLGELAERLWLTGEKWVLEAQVDYLTHQAAGQSLELSPSVHVRHGHLADGMTLQITNGTSWQGNVYLDEAVCESVGMTLAQYREIRADLTQLHDGFRRHDLSLVTAGFDFAIARVGGGFGDRPLVALQDPNLSSHGAEYLRLFLDDVLARGGPTYGATKVINSIAPLPLLHQLAERATPSPWVRVISAIPGGWGMLAAAADRPDEAIELISDWEEKWSAEGLINRAAYR